MRWYHVPVMILGLAAATWTFYMIFQGVINVTFP